MHLKITFAVKTISHLFSPEDASFTLQSNLLVFPKGPASPRSAETADSPHSERTLAQRDPLFLGFPKSLPFSIYTKKTIMKSMGNHLGITWIDQR